MSFATYAPGTTVVHRLPAGLKLSVLAALGIALAVLDQWWQPLVLIGAVLACYAVARLPIAGLLALLRPLLWIFIAVGIFHAVISGWQAVVDVLVSLIALVLAAGLVSLTTSMTELTDVLLWLLRPLRRFGVAPERLALLISLSVRSVPVIVGLAQEVRDAQRARGLGRSARAFAVPLLVRSLRHADALGEALVARGLDD
jgi:biotin transport system permease protein